MDCSKEDFTSQMKQNCCKAGGGAIFQKYEQCRDDEELCDDSMGDFCFAEKVFLKCRNKCGCLGESERVKDNPQGISDVSGLEGQSFTGQGFMTVKEDGTVDSEYFGSWKDGMKDGQGTIFYGGNLDTGYYGEWEKDFWHG
jgi:hypothetical protein